MYQALVGDTDPTTDKERAHTGEVHNAARDRTKRADADARRRRGLFVRFVDTITD